MAVSSKDDVLERVKSFVFYLNEPMKLDDYQTAQNNLQQAWNTATGGKTIHNLPELVTFVLICEGPFTLDKTMYLLHDFVIFTRHV